MGGKHVWNLVGRKFCAKGARDGHRRKVGIADSG